ncbi:MAG TPA: hypothetical protein VK809_09150 [Bacteroidia bacterium]|jgi:hypothetical protein|nr:hypothetical protein [Bacteroidia bacterium]
MKTTLIIILLSIAVFLMGCTANQSSTTQTIVLMDVTDKFLSRPVATDILNLYGFNQNIYNGGIFQLSDLTKVSFNAMQEVKVAKVNQWLSNQFQRQKEIDTFRTGISTIISQAELAPTGENNSSIYYPVANALNELAQSPADKKYALIYSDLMEHTPQISFYNKNTLKEVKEEPDVIKALLESQVQLQSVQGITIYLLYEPTNSLQDEEFKIVSKFYSDFFESKGATVIVAPNIQM